jgi:hypothetical protein
MDGSVAIRKFAWQCRSLRRPRNKICLRRTQLVRRGSQSALFDHVNRLNTGQQNACATKRLEAEHGPDDALDGSIVLLYDVVQRLHLPQVDRRAGIFLNGVDGSGVGATLVDGDLVRQAVLADGAFQEAARCGQMRLAGRWCKLMGEAKNALFLSLLIKRRARHSILPALRSL